MMRSIVCIHTTLNLDEDVLRAVQQRAKREGRPAGHMLSDLARQALTGQHRATSDRGAARHGFEPLSHRGAAVSNALIDRLREDDPE